jgi:VWFA-related protein
MRPIAQALHDKISAYRYPMSWPLRVLVFIALSTICAAEGITYLRLERGLLEQKLNLSPETSAERVKTLKNLFEKAGCTPGNIYEQPVPGEDSPNVICVLPGTGSGTLVIGSPLDYKEHKEKGLVQWAGLTMLPVLAESLDAVAHRDTFIFVAFAGASGVHGAAEYLRQLSDEKRKSVEAMVELQSIGRTPAMYAPSQKDSYLGNWLVASARLLKLHDEPVDVGPRQLQMAARAIRHIDLPGKVNPADAKTFQNANISAITVTSLSEIPAPNLSLPGQNQIMIPKPNLDIDSYENTYHLLSIYLLVLDRGIFKTHSPVQSPVVVASTPPANGPPPAANTNTPENAKPDVAASVTPPLAATTPIATAASRPPTSNSESTQVFRSTARLVQVDVSVTDKNGKPLEGFQASDFTVLENGKPQSVKVFEVHSAAISAPTSATPAQPSLPPHTFSNRTQMVADQTVNILLFDLLNTAEQDQSYARKQMIQYLRDLPAGQRIALFVLTSRLDMVQGFTGSSDRLIQAAESLLTHHSPVMTSDAEAQELKGEAQFIGETLMGGHTAAPQTGGGATIDPTSRMEQAVAVMEAQRTDARVGLTLQALNGIARAVWTYPGRKNLIWLSGSFPVRVRPDQDAVNPSRSERDYTEAVHNTGNLLASSRIAVYPVDVRGVRTTGLDISVSSSASGSSAGASGDFGKTLAEQSGGRFDQETVMRDLADQTGGEAFIGNNDLHHSIQRGIQDGSTYYTLAYTPQDSDKEIDFRHLEVKLNRKNVKLSYRRGYYWAAHKTTENESSAHIFALAMQPGTPPSSMVPLTVQVVSPGKDKDQKVASLEYRIDLGDIGLSQSTDGKWHGVVDCMAVAFDQKGKDAGQVANTLEINMSQAEYQSAMRDGLPMKQEIALPPGSYTVRVGAMERGTQKIGTVDVPVEIMTPLAAK